MAARHGKFGMLSVAGTEIGTFLDQMDLALEGETADTTTMGSTWRTHIPGLLTGSLSIGGVWDPTAATGPAAVLFAAFTGGAAVAVVHKPGGTATGQRTNSGNAIVTAYNEGTPVGDKVTFTAELLFSGAITPTTQ